MGVRGAAAGAGITVLALVTWSRAVAGPADVAIHIFQFKPGRVDVAVGTTVTWTNRDDIAHRVTSGSPEQPERRFDAALAGKGAMATVRFGEPGVYPYFCSRHQAMRGEIRVQ